MREGSGCLFFSLKAINAAHETMLINNEYKGNCRTVFSAVEQSLSEKTKNFSGDVILQTLAEMNSVEISAMKESDFQSD